MAAAGGKESRIQSRLVSFFACCFLKNICNFRSERMREDSSELFLAVGRGTHKKNFKGMMKLSRTDLEVLVPVITACLHRDLLVGSGY